MTLQELHTELIELGISEDRYYIHGLYGSTNDDNKLALIIKNRKQYTEYEVYYKDRGEKHSERVFMTEDEACKYILRKLKDNKKIEDKYSK